MVELGQPALFMIRDGEDALDEALDDLGFYIRDPVRQYACKTDAIAAMSLPSVAAFSIWHPLAIQREIWETGGIGPERVDVMRRARGPRTSILARNDDQPSGTAFVAIHQGIAMVHAVEVLPEHRRKGAARNMMVVAARWAQAQGSPYISCLCTVANEGANQLYRGLGFRDVGGYHYRRRDA